MNPARVLVLGASGQVGRFVLPMLAGRGWQVLAVSRRGQPSAYPELPGVQWLRLDAETGPAALPASSALVSAGPIALAVRCLEQQASVRRVVALSTSSVLSKAGSPDAGERAQVAEILAAEQALLQWRRGCGGALCLLRPTLVYGGGLDRNLTLLARFIERHGWLPVARGANGLRQPVHAADLALAAARALALEPPAEHLGALVGGSTLTYQDMVLRLFAAFGRRPRLLRIPGGLLANIVALAGRSGFAPGLRAGMVHRQCLDLVFDDAPMRAALGVQPRAFEPVAADFRPPGAADLLALLAPAAT